MVILLITLDWRRQKPVQTSQARNGNQNQPNKICSQSGLVTDNKVVGFKIGVLFLSQPRRVLCGVSRCLESCPGSGDVNKTVGAHILALH